MKYFVYVLRSEVDGRFYVGMSADVDKRLKEHNTGKTKSTKGYIPWILFFYEELETRIDARAREKYLKSGVGKEFIKRKWSGSSVGYLPAGRQGAKPSKAEGHWFGSDSDCKENENEVLCLCVA